MTALHIRDVPEDTVAALKARAERHGRSMQAELVEILNEEAAKPLPRRRRRPLRLKTVRTGRAEPFGRDEIYADDDDR